MNPKEMSTQDIRGRLDHVNGVMAQALTDARMDNGSYDFSKAAGLDGSDAQARVESFRALNDEATELGQELDERKNLDAAQERIKAAREIQHVPLPVGSKRDKQDEHRTLGEMFTESKAFGKVGTGQMGPEATFDVDVKSALFSTSAGWVPPTVRSDRVVDYALRPLVLADLLPTVTVSLPTYLYMEETTFVNSMVEVAEGGSKPEVSLGLTERTVNIRKIAGYLPVTDEQLDDVPAARAYIDNRLGYMVGQRLDTQILAGNGSGQNILGINRAGRSSMQTQAKGGDPTPDAVYNAITLIRVNAFSEPNATVWHPNDWAQVRLLRTADGIYIWGNPADGGPDRIWGLRVVQTVARSEGTVLVGDFNQAALLLREGLTMKVGYVNDDLIKNRQTIVAEMRAAVAVFRPAAFCEVTGV